MRLRETASRPAGAGGASGRSRTFRAGWRPAGCLSRNDGANRSAGATGSILTTALPLDSAAADLAQRLRLRNKRGHFARPNRCGIVPPLERTARSTRLERRCHRQRKAPDGCKIDLPARAARSSRPLFRLIRRRLTSPTVVYATNPTVLSERGWRTTWWPRRRELLAPLSALNGRLL